MAWFDEDEMKGLVKAFNRGGKEPIKAKEPAAQWEELKQRLHEKCTTGETECIVSALLQRPKAPKQWAVNRWEWLSSDDIDHVEKNYEELFPDYMFVGCVPIDFDLKSDETNQCLVSALCSMKLPEMYKAGHHRIGIVFNTDPHDGPGEHWIALFCDIRPELEYAHVTYFDSYAQSPEPEIKVLMRRWKEQWDKTGIHPGGMKMTFNTTRHQFKDSECGMYCLYFHYASLMGIPMYERIPDDVVNSYRKMLFRVPKEKSDKKQ
jgi:hypothetical protein